MYSKITEEQRQEIVENACPGPGACGGMYTANTMATAIEALGMSLPYSSSTPAIDPLKTAECKLAGDAILNLLKLDLKPRDIMTKKAFENAITIVMVLGGSTNAVLHLIAMARAVDVDLTLADFQRISDKTPFLADLKPSGKYVMADMQAIGGTPAVLRYLLDNGMIHGECMTVTGKTMAENLASIKPVPVGNPIVMPLESPIKASGHLQVRLINI
jgi:dihydroxy-acid dehydratase